MAGGTEMRMLESLIKKLERRLETQNRLSASLVADTLLRHMSDRAVRDIEQKLFGRRRQLEILSAGVTDDAA